MEIKRFQYWFRLTGAFFINDFRIKYRNTLLGYFWSILEPLLLFIILYVVYSLRIFRFTVINYPLFLLTGIIIYHFFSQSTKEGLKSIVQKTNIIQNLKLPLSTIIISSMLHSIITLLINLSILIIFMVITNPTIYFYNVLLYLPLIIFISIILFIGISFILSSIMVKWRDIMFLWGVFVRLMFWITPILYPLSIIPKNFQKYFLYNPLTIIIGELRNILILNGQPNLINILYLGISSFIILILGYLFFNKISKNIAEVI